MPSGMATATGTTSASAPVRNAGVQQLQHGDDASLDAAAKVNGLSSGEEAAHQTPTKRGRGRPPGSRNKPKVLVDGVLSKAATPSKSKGKVLFATPRDKARVAGDNSSSKKLHTPSGHRTAKLVDRTVRDAEHGNSEDEGLDDVGLTSKTSWQNGSAGSRSESSDCEDETTGQRTPAKPRGRPRGSGKQRASTPPRDLPPYEQYFWQNRPGRPKTSNNTLSDISLLTHDHYHEQISSYLDDNTPAYETLHTIHARSFPQWHFELSEGFNVCLYGYGSKRRLVSEFAEYLHDETPDRSPKILIVNGYNNNVNLRSLFNTLAALIYECSVSDLPSGLGTQPAQILTSSLAHLRLKPPSLPLYVFINSLDALSFRKAPIPSMFAQLASHPSIHMLATCDTPNFPLLWDTTLRDAYNFAFHDTTTFISFGDVEISTVVDDANDLLGRSRRTIKGKEGVAFVLRSLPENARNLYRVLCTELLSAAINDDIDMENDPDIDDPSGGDVLQAMPSNQLFLKAVEDFICSNETGFRQLLKEFIDHEMIHSSRDAGGTEVLGVPWRREECMTILEELSM